MASGSANRPAGAPPPSAVPSFPRPWQPLTPRGVAAFARASLPHVYGFQGLVAFISCLAVTALLGMGVLPVARDLIGQLPEEGALRHGDLVLGEDAVLRVAQNSWLGLSLDTGPAPRAGLPTELSVVFGRQSLRLCSPFGCLSQPYPPNAQAPISRVDMQAGLEAWQPLILGASAFLSACLLLVTWWVLATAYCLVPRVMAFFGDRDLDLPGAWKLSAASLLPAALVLDAAIVGLALEWIGLPQVLTAFVLHLLVPFVFMGLAVWTLPLREAPAPAFGPAPSPAIQPSVSELEPATPSLTTTAPASSPGVAPRRNPFAPTATKSAQDRSGKSSNPFS